MGCLFGYYGTPVEGLLDRMAQRLSHRCKRGWERVSIDTAAGQRVEIGHGIPPWSDAGRVWSSASLSSAFGYSGVIFNLEKIFPSSPDKIDPVRGPSPPDSFFPASLAHDPDACLEALEGSFVAALATADGLRLIRDSSGIKALYWTAHRERIIFASEIKALFADDLVHRRMRISALPEYLTFSFVPSRMTMFEDVEELQPGHILRYHEGGVSTRRYFTFEDHEWNGEDGLSPEFYASSVRSDLEESVKECLAATDQLPAVNLSGGIDSSAVLAVAASQRPDHAFKTFSVHFGSGYANENQFVSLMVDRYHTDHTWLEVKPAKFLKRMKQIIWILDDPIGDPVTVPNFLLAEAAGSAGNVVLNGEGGDPCFGGPKNIPMLLAALYGPEDGANSDGWLERSYLQSFKKCFSDLKALLSRMF